MQQYIIQPGESLSAISQKFYGDFSMVAEIAQVNNIANDNLVYAGQVISLPDSKPTLIQPTPPAPDAAAGKRYTWLWWLLGLSALGVAGYKGYQYYQQKKKQAS